MSQESAFWLNNFVLIGFTEKYGNFWHFNEDEQGDESNHYPGPIPLADVERRIFNWEPCEGKLIVTYTDSDGNDKQIIDTERKAILRPDTGDVFGIFKNGYQIHSYNEWLTNQIATILDDELQISSAGLLRKGAQGWVQVEMNEPRETPEGITFRPHLLGCTSLDGSLATTYGRSVINTGCDNTMSASLSTMGDQKLKLKHTKYSKVRITEAHEALQIVHEIGDAFATEVAEFTNITVTDADWEKFLDEINPIPEDEGRGKTIAQNKRDTLTTMYNHDDRVKPWAGTAWGVVQCINTFSHWENQAHGEDENPNARNERNMSRAVKGDVDKLDRTTLDTLTAVLA